MSENLLVQSSTMTIIGTCATLCFIIPIITLIAYKKNTGAKLKPFVYGLIMFLAFALGVEQILHAVVLAIDTPVSRFLANHMLAYCIYGAVAAAVCEEFGRLIGFKLLGVKETDKKASVMYGIGHGGAECLAVGAYSLFTTLIYATILNSQGYDAFVNAGGPEQASYLASLADSIINTNPYLFFISVFERVVALVLQISLSFIVYKSVKEKESKHFFYIALGIHFVFDFFAALYQVGVIKNLIVEEAVLAAMAVGVAVFAVKVFKKTEE